MRGKCERRGGNINAGAAGAEVFAGDGCSQGASFVPMAAISRRWRGGRIYNNTRARERLRRKCVNPRRPHNPFPAEGRRPSPHNDTPFPSTFSLPPRPDARPPTSPPIPHRRPSLTPAQRHALPEHFLTPSPPRRTLAGCAMHARQPHNPFLAEGLRPPPHSDAPFPSTSAPPRSPDARPQAAPCIPRRPHDPFPAESLRPSPHSDTPVPTATRPSPSVPLRAQKNGTAQWMCDAECLGRPSLRSVIGVDEPRAVRRRYGALAWRVGLRPQPWALRSRRCGRVLRA